MEIKYNIPIEVSQTQYNRLMNECDGIVAGRKEDGKYYIKVWLMKYVNYVKDILK